MSSPFKSRPSTTTRSFTPFNLGVPGRVPAPAAAIAAPARLRGVYRRLRRVDTPGGRSPAPRADLVALARRDVREREGPRVVHARRLRVEANPLFLLVEPA